MKNKTTLTFRELIELVESSVKSQKIEKDYADYLDCCKGLGVSSYTLNLIIQRAKASTQQADTAMETDASFWVKKKIKKVIEIKKTGTAKQTQKEVVVKNKSTKHLWFSLWGVVLGLILEAAGLYFINDKRKDTEAHLWTTSNRLNTANRHLKQIEDVIANVPRDTTFGSWTSRNKENNTESSKRYRFYASSGDVLDFKYFVSSEQNYDFLTITLTSDVAANEELVKESGIVKNSCTKTFQKAGEYSLLVKYKKDGSYSYHDDNGGIQTFHLYRNSQIEALADSISSILKQ